jgi:hypothetical protein
MGCDIHPYFEAKNDDGNWERIITRHDELWNYLYGRDEEEEADTTTPIAVPSNVQRTSVLKPVRKIRKKGDTPGPAPDNEPTEVEIPGGFQKPESELTPDEREELLEEMWNHPTDLGRNYNLFSILADVRNGVGFAGCKAGEGFEPISMPRGFPVDASPSVKKANCCSRTVGEETEKEWRAQAMKWVTQGYSVVVQEDPLLVSSPDWHSHSYYLLQELLDYDWDEKTSIQTGIIEQSVYAEWKKSGDKAPASQCGWVSGLFVVHITEEEMKRRIKEDLPAEEPTTKKAMKRNEDTGEEEEGEEIEGTQHFYCEVNYPMKYSDCFRHFVDTVIPFLKGHADEHLSGDYSRLRFTFWFDN